MRRINWVGPVSRESNPVATVNKMLYAVIYPKKKNEIESEIV